MMGNPKAPKRGLLGRLTSLVLIVGFVFFILLVSFAVAGTLLVRLVDAGFMPKVSGNTLLTFLVFMLFVSLTLATFMAGIGGTLMMRPVRRLIEATQKVRAGDYTVRVEPRGTSELQRLAESFNEMTQELGSVEGMRNDFVHSISHEFKTPVVSIRGFAKLLKKDTLSKEKRDEYLDVIIAESDRMTQLSSNMLLLCKLDTDEHMPESEAFQLDEQLRRAVLLMEPAMRKKEIALQVMLAPVRITANAEMLHHVWLNLLSNAVKFTPEGGAITVALEQTEDAIRVCVSDTGIGMPREVQAHIFDKFYQGDASRATAGNGLGLALSQRIVHLCNGKITVDSAPDAGATFIVELPKP